MEESSAGRSPRPAVEEKEFAGQFRGLACLVALADLIETPGISLGEVLERSVALVPPTWEHPESIGVRLTVDGREYRTDGYRETQHKLSSDLRVFGRSVGSLEVCRVPGSSDGPFSKPESDLVTLFAERLQRVIERMRMTEEIEADRERLRALWDIATSDQSDRRAVFCQLLETIVGMTGSAYGFYGLVDEDEGVMRIMSWSGDAMKDCATTVKPLDFSIREAGVWAEAVRRREPFVLNDYAGPHAAKRGLPEGHVPLSSLLAVPFLSGGRCVALTVVADKATPYDEADVTRINSLLVSAQAIVERHRAREASDVLGEIVANLAEGVCLINPADNSIVYANGEFDRMFGYAPGEVIGRPVDILGGTVGDGVHLATDAISTSVRKAGTWRGELLNIKKDGTEFWTRTQVSRMPHPEYGVVAIAVHTDVTEIRAAREAMHDLAADLVRNGARERRHLADELHDDLGQVLAAAKMAGRQVQAEWGEGGPPECLTRLVGLVDIAIASVRQLTLELSPPVLRELGLAAALEWLIGSYEERYGLKADLFVESDVAEMKSDAAGLVFRVARELLNNAQRYAGTGSVRVEVMPRRDAVVLRVSDEGAGFDPADLDHGVVSGGGFGLRSIREELGLAGGAFTIDSALGRGTRIEAAVPVDLAWSEERANGS